MSYNLYIIIVKHITHPAPGNTRSGMNLLYEFFKKFLYIVKGGAQYCALAG